MSFVDELKIHIKAGDGGNGISSWIHEKGKEYGGPGGGDGGAGGNIYLKAVRDISLLSKYRHEKEFRAGRGESGKNKNMHGRDGDDLHILLPMGSIVKNLATGKEVELVEDGKEVLLLKGGKGGWGNTHFKGARNQNPWQTTEGKVGEEGDFFIELQLVADAGLIGLPNAGKSSLLNELTNAGAKVGAYQFTTLEPNLGDFYGYILADIPGLIEGASEGRGLGVKFLRHIRRTKILLHCISLESKSLVGDYNVIRDELKNYSQELADKKEVVILTKTDSVTKEQIKVAKDKIKKKCKTVFTVSILDDKAIKKLKDDLVKILKKSSP